MAVDIYQWRRAFHVPVLITLQIIFIILFGCFVVYDPRTAESPSKDSSEAISVYPMFQDVHVMIFIGFGFLMTFLKKYGLSAVSLNMLCAVVCLQWATLVIGFFHLHDHVDIKHADGTVEHRTYPRGVIFMNLVDSMLLSDFASAAVLISFGVVIGKTSPLQLIVMALIEIVLFVVNEVIGRKYIGAVDAGDTIFVHLFGAYFGLAISRVLYSDKTMDNANQATGRTSDMFSLVGTVFLWMFWPSFNSAAAAPGEPQHRAILNTYFSLCACVLASFAMSAATHEKNKFVMEHIQNATLAGGVAIGACADLIVEPFGALIIGGCAGIISTWGFEFASPWIAKHLKIHDTCGVHNLHGMPGVIGSALSCILAVVATTQNYGDGLYKVYPALNPNMTDEHTGEIMPNPDVITAQQQAMNQLAATVCTFVIAVVGGGFTGFILKWIGEWQHLDTAYKRGMTVMKLAKAVGKLTNNIVDIEATMPAEVYFDDNLFFEVADDNDPVEEAVQQEQTVVVKDEGGKTTQYRRYSTYNAMSYEQMQQMQKYSGGGHTGGGALNLGYMSGTGSKEASSNGGRRSSIIRIDQDRGQGVQVMQLPPNSWGARRASITPGVPTLRE